MARCALSVKRLHVITKTMHAPRRSDDRETECVRNIVCSRSVRPGSSLEDVFITCREGSGVEGKIRPQKR